MHAKIASLTQSVLRAAGISRGMRASAGTTPGGRTRGRTLSLGSLGSIRPVGLLTCCGAAS
jgi:hypothetical protein